jgi:zinc/manganese transport system substrate-binding protein
MLYHYFTEGGCNFMFFQEYLKGKVGLGIFFLFGLLFLGACSNTGVGSAPTSVSSSIPVVAAENFYGDITQQIGGSRVNVTSIISDPNIDPHTFEANPKYTRAIGGATLVIENGGGYDDWMDKLLSSTPSTKRQVLKGFDLATVKIPDNEHVWYSYENADSIATAIARQLEVIDNGHSSEYKSNLQVFKKSLQGLQDKISEIKGKYQGTAVGLTETIFQYQTGPMNLVVKTPEAFQKAMAEGNDPPASAVAITEDQVNKRQIKVLIVNQQTTSKFTDTLQSEAKAQNIPIVAVTETMPGGKTYQTWMLDQLDQLEQALKK